MTHPSSSSRRSERRSAADLHRRFAGHVNIIKRMHRPAISRLGTVAVAPALVVLTAMCAAAQPPATLAVTEAETARIAADVRADVRRAYYQAVGAVRRVANAQELEAIQTRARDAAQDRFQTGAAPRLEALQASLALSQAQNEVTAA